MKTNKHADGDPTQDRHNTIMTRRTKPELNDKEEGYSKPLPHFNQPRQSQVYSQEST
jgi:hypothetical protein